MVEAPPVTVAEAIWTAANKGNIAGVEIDTTPKAALRGLVNDGPVRLAPTDRQELSVYGNLIGHHTLHDAMLLASHGVRGTDSIVSNDSAFVADGTV